MICFVVRTVVRRTFSNLEWVQSTEFKFSLILFLWPYPQSQLEIEEERQKVNASILALEEELEGYKEQSDQWNEQLSSANRE